MKKIFVSFFILSLFLPSFSFAQNQGNQNELQAEVGQPLVEARPYGLELKNIVKGIYNDQAGYPTATTSETIMSGYAWGGVVAGWLVLGNLI